jgi:hypothetical protein
MVTINGPVTPVTATLRFVLVPEQIVAVPLNVALLGGVFTVTVALPVPATPQFASVTLPTILYVVVTAGFTGIAVPLT